MATKSFLPPTRIHWLSKKELSVKLLNYCVTTVAILFAPLVPAAEVIKSELDEREYKVIELDNQIKVALVSDARLQKAAASISVAVGSNANPKGREGLAHFLEHMLFLGTEKFPQVDEYQGFISANGGSHNAFTAYDNTTYFFDIKADALEPALDRFSQFFIAPLFTPEYVERERNAVHSEFESKRLEDGRRNYVADKLLMNPEHSWAMFTVGNLDTLSNDADAPIRPDLIDFYQRYYSANLMTGAIIGPQSIQQLEQLATDYFSPIENRNVAPFIDTLPLYDEQQLPLQLDVKTVKAMQQLSISFPLAERRSHWESKPLYYIANQLGYEGEGSLLSYLKAQGWVESLGAWIGIDLDNQSRFDISMDLTPEGQTHEAEIVAALFAKLELMRQQGLREELYEEQRQMAQIDFRFQQPGEPSHEVTRFARMLAEYPAEELLHAGYLFKQYEPEQVLKYLNLMRPERMIISRYSDEAVTDSTESFYGIEYRISKPDQRLVQQWRKPNLITALKIKALNPYVANSFELKPGEVSSKPKLLRDTDLLQLWHLQDRDFGQPRAAINLAIFSPEVSASPTSAVASTLLTRMLNELSNETLYDAALAGLEADLYPHLRGLSIKVSGYDERLPTLFAAQLDALNLPLEDSALFERLKQSYAEELENSLKDKPYNRTFSLLFDELMEGWSVEARLAALPSLTLEQLIEQRTRLLSKGRLKLFAHGNLSASDANDLGSLLETRFSQMQSIAVPQLQVEQLSQTQALSVPVDHTDSALLLYLQGGDKSLAQRAEISLLNEMLSAPFYTSLRTEQQLGYIVFSNYLPMDEQPGIALVAQSPVADGEALKEAFTLFLQQWREGLPELLDKRLEEFKASLASRISTPSQRLSDETARLWREIDRENPDFDTREQLLEALSQVDAAALLSRFDKLVAAKLWISTTNESAN